MPTCLLTVFGCFLVTKAELGGCSTDCMTWKVSNVYHLALSRESLSTPSLGDKVLLQLYITMLHSVRVITGEVCCKHV